MDEQKRQQPWLTQWGDKNTAVLRRGDQVGAGRVSGRKRERKRETERDGVSRGKEWERLGRERTSAGGQRTCIICEKKRNSFTPTVFGVAVQAGRVGNDVGFDRQQNCWTDDIGAKRHDCLSSAARLCTRALATWWRWKTRRYTVIRPVLESTVGICLQSDFERFWLTIMRFYSVENHILPSLEVAFFITRIIISEWKLLQRKIYIFNFRKKMGENNFTITILQIWKFWIPFLCAKWVTGNEHSRSFKETRCVWNLCVGRFILRHPC